MNDKPDIAQLPHFVDISCVQARHSREDIDQLANVARTEGFVSAHVLPNWVPYLREALAGSATLTGSPVGFPSGGSTTRVKLFEAEQLLADGAQEMDVVVNIGRLRSADMNYVEKELSEIVALVAGRIPLRAILEVGYLSPDEIRAGCEAAVAAGVGWVKTATGWSGIPTTVEHIQIIADQLRGRALMKAAGGIRSLDVVRQMIDLGVVRFGMNSRTALELAAEAKRGDHA